MMVALVKSGQFDVKAETPRELAGDCRHPASEAGLQKNPTTYNELTVTAQPESSAALILRDAD